MVLISPCCVDSTAMNTIMLQTLHNYTQTLPKLHIIHCVAMQRLAQAAEVHIHHKYRHNQCKLLKVRGTRYQHWCKLEREVAATHNLLMSTDKVHSCVLEHVASCCCISLKTCTNTGVQSAWHTHSNLRWWCLVRYKQNELKMMKAEQSQKPAVCYGQLKLQLHITCI